MSGDDLRLDAMAVIDEVAHELRTPLATITGFTSLLLARWDDLADDDKREMLAAVRDDADRVNRMLAELLDVSRLEVGTLHLALRPLDIGTLVASVVAKVGVRHPDLDVVVEVAGDLPEVVADADKVEQVLANLLENAAKYAGPAAVGVAVGADAEGGVEIAVADRGPGIAPEDVERIFERSFRSPSARPSGTGLGLWISRGLVEAHGGTLTVTTAVGQGSTFALTLPAVPPNGVGGRGGDRAL